MARIRFARDADAEAIAAIYEPFVEHTAISFEAMPPRAEDMRRRILDTTVTYPWLVCERGGRIAGYAYAIQHRVRDAYRWSVDTSVYVDAAHHRLGVGRGLYASLFAILEAQGFRNAFAGITLPNAASVALHEAIGFEPIGVYARVGYKLGQWHDVGWWQLQLRTHVVDPDEPRPVSALFDGPDWDALLGRGERLVRAS